MSTISDWLDDYTGGDTNVPASNTAIPFPANTTTDLGETLRDVKHVFRQESLNKGWQPDAVAATYVSNTSLTLTGDVGASYPPGTALKCALGNSTVYTWVQDVSVSGNTTIDVSSTVLTNALTTVTRSAFLPPSNPIASNEWDYPMGVGSALPPRVSQIGSFRMSETTNTATVPFTKVEPDTNYRVLIQLVDSVSLFAGSAYNAQRFTSITKANSSMTVTLAAAPGGGNYCEFEFALLRVT